MYKLRLVSSCAVAALVLATVPAAAQGTSKRLATLEAAVAELQAAVGALQSTVAALQTNLAGEAATRAAAVATLQGQIDKLRGNITTEDLIGTYNVYLVGTAMDRTFGGLRNEVASYVYAGTLTLAADGTGSLSATAAGRIITEQSPGLNWTSTDVSGAAVAGNLTWTYADNNKTVRIEPNPGVQFNDLDLSVAVGGQVLVSVAGGPPGNNQQLVVLTRQ